MRKYLFLSHANPEDNEFTLWLALQLARHGYAVWSDRTSLLGGEDFWKDAEAAIRDDVVRFLFVLSSSSNGKDGPLQELRVAKAVARKERLRNFVVPLRVDDIAYPDMNIELGRLNALDFWPNWANGLSQLLHLLAKSQIPTDPGYSPTQVAKWWKAQHEGQALVLERPEEYLSNWFTITFMPDEVYVHRLTATAPGGLPGTISDIPRSVAQGEVLLSFANAEELSPSLPRSCSIAGTRIFLASDLLHNRTTPQAMEPLRGRDALTALLKKVWGEFATNRGLLRFNLATGSPCFFFPNGCVDGNIVWFSGVNGRTFRAVVGRRSLWRPHGEPPRKRFWHLGIEAYPIAHPDPAFVFKSHVLFSDDGRNIWERTDRLHSARRSQCKNWWNADWRDRLLASVAWLAAGEANVEIPVAPTRTVRVASSPICFSSPVSFDDPSAQPGVTAEVQADDDSDTPVDTLR